jgi:predicted transcriptional regulator
MPVSTIDLLLGFKAIGLLGGLTDSDRRVGFVLLDHFNRTTTQCDPSLETVATLLGISRRSVIRSVNKLAKHRLVRRIRHGGGFHRNFYEPAWSTFKEFEVLWRQRRREHSRRMRAKNLSLRRCHQDHLVDDDPVTQTSTNNLLERTCTDSDPKPPSLSRQSTPTRRPAKGVAKPMNISSSEAADAAAERRWVRPFQKHFDNDPTIYGRVLEHVDRPFVEAINAIEKKQPGSGVFAAIERLKKANVI